MLRSRNSVLYTIEGNRTPQVHGFDYVLSRMEKLLGYGHVPEKVVNYKRSEGVESEKSEGGLSRNHV